MTLSVRLKKAMSGEKKEGGGPDLLQQPPSSVQLIEQVLDKRRTYPGWFRPSMLQGCKRQNIYHYIQAQPWHPSQMDNRLMRILDNGTAVHKVLQDYMASHPDIWFTPEAKVETYIHGALIKGSCDGLVTRRSDGYRWIVEFKTINHDDFMRLSKAKPEHVQQATTYAVLQRVHWITVIYWDKDKNVLKEFHSQVDPKVWAATTEKVKELKEYVDRKKLPMYDRSTCNTTFCQFVERCRKDGAPV